MNSRAVSAVYAARDEPARASPKYSMLCIRQPAAGSKIKVVHPETGDVVSVELFVELGASSYT